VTELRHQAERVGRRFVKGTKKPNFYTTWWWLFHISSGFRIKHQGEKRAIISSYRLIPWCMRHSSSEYFSGCKEPYFGFIAFKVGGNTLRSTDQGNPSTVPLSCIRLFPPFLPSAAVCHQQGHLTWAPFSHIPARGNQPVLPSPKLRSDAAHPAYCTLPGITHTPTAETGSGPPADRKTRLYLLAISDTTAWTKGRTQNRKMGSPRHPAGWRCQTFWPDPSRKRAALGWVSAAHSPGQQPVGAGQPLPRSLGWVCEAGAARPGSRLLRLNIRRR